MRRYIGLAIQWFGGLVTLIREPLLRPVQIVRQFISNHDTRIAAYHANQGLSSLPQKARESRRITHIPGRITNLIVGYGDMQETMVLQKKGLMVFYLFKHSPCKSMIENQKYKIVKGAI